MSTYRDITVIDLFSSADYPNGRVIAAGTTVTTGAFDIGAHAAGGLFSLQIYVQGSGTSIFAGYLLSNDGHNWIESTEGNTINATGFHHMCGRDANGRDIVTFEPPMAARMKIELWETVGAAGSTVTGKLAIF